MKLIMVDLDGTLFDTKEVNYLAYKEALKQHAFDIEHEYYCKYCNGRHYLDFLPQITTGDKAVLTSIHNLKKNAYSKYLNFAKPNDKLIELLKMVKPQAKIALVTTASKKKYL